MPCTIWGDKKVIYTNDGSFSFYSIGYNESYKTKTAGAYTESLHKFVNASGIVDKLRYKDVRLLDICFGTGMNLAVTIDEMLKNNISNGLHAVSVELDYNLLSIVDRFKIFAPVSGYNILREAIKKGSSGNFSIEQYIMDACCLLDDLSGKFDIIYFDPFSKKHNEKMWSATVIRRLKGLLADDGVIVTYASSKGIRASFCDAGFRFKENPSVGDRHQPSSIFTHQSFQA